MKKCFFCSVSLEIKVLFSATIKKSTFSQIVPFSRSTTLSQASIAASLCEMQITVFPLTVFKFNSSFFSVARSSTEVHSSSSKIGASLTSALAISMRCLCPSESPIPHSPSTVSSPSDSSFITSVRHAVSSAFSTIFSSAPVFPNRILSRIVQEIIIFPCRTYANIFLAPTWMLLFPFDVWKKISPFCTSNRPSNK